MTGEQEAGLDAIGRLMNCDKSSLIHGYLDIYEGLFAPLRGLPITILEFCASDLSSLKVWKRYFSQAKVVGLFPDPPAAGLGELGILTEVGHQADVQRLVRLIEEYDPDIVIDDGSHQWSAQTTAMRTVVPLLKPRAIYAVEDLQTSFGDTRGYDGGRGPHSSFARYLAEIIPGLISGYREFAPLADDFQTFAPHILESIVFSRQLCFLRRNNSRFLRHRLRAKGDQDLRFDYENGGTYTRLPAEVEGLETGLREQFEHFRKVDRVVAPPARVSELHNATVYGRGVVATASGQILSDSLINVYGDQSWFEGLYRPVGSDIVLAGAAMPATDLPGDTPHVLLKQRWDGNYGHWLIESLSRLSLVREHYDLGACRFVVGEASPAMGRVYLDSLRFAGVDPASVLVTSDTALKIQRLVYPHPLTVQPWVKAPLVFRFLEELRDRLLAAPQEGSPGLGARKLLVLRGGGSRRQLINASEVRDIAVRQGFTPVSPDSMSFAEQVAAFSNAEMVIGVLGAELANLSFAPMGVKLLGLAPEAMQDDFFYDLICHKKGVYHSLHGPAAAGQNGLGANFVVTAARFEAMLDRMTQAQSPASFPE